MSKNTAPSSRRKASRGRMPDGGANPIDVHIGARVRLRRTLMGMSQEALGEVLGITFQQVQKYERGANRVSASRMFDLSRALNVPVSFFYDDMPPELSAFSPAAVSLGTAPATSAPDQTSDLQRVDVLMLVRSYLRLPKHQASQVRSLIEAMAKSEPSAQAA